MIKKSLRTERIYVQKGKARTGHLDSFICQIVLEDVTEIGLGPISEDSLS